jgi:hypothetical protein
MGPIKDDGGDFVQQGSRMTPMNSLWVNNKRITRKEKSETAEKENENSVLDWQSIKHSDNDRWKIGGKQWKANKCSEERKILWIDNGRELICVSQSNIKLDMSTKPLLFDKNAMQCIQCNVYNAMYTMQCNVFNVYTLIQCIQCLYNVCMHCIHTIYTVMSIHCIHIVYNIQCMCTVYNVYTHCIQHTMYVYCIQCMYTMCIQCIDITVYSGVHCMYTMCTMNVYTMYTHWIHCTFLYREI